LGWNDAEGKAGQMIDPEALSPEKRDQILQGAAVVFAQDGYEGASMSRIAREANVSKGTLYNHFHGKADLFSAHLEQACARYLNEVFDPVEPADPLEVTLAGIGRRMMSMIMTPERRSLYRMVISEAESFPELARAFYQSGPRAAVVAMSDWVAAEVRRGRLAVEDTDFAAEQFFALCQTRLAIRYRLYLQAEPDEAEIDEVVRGAVTTFLARYGAPA
jgi:AcrR family transcriptional regulator